MLLRWALFVSLAVGLILPFAFGEWSALVGFGLDSMVEVSSGLIILWQFRHAVPVSRERLALRLIAVSFFALAGYVSIDAVRALLK